MVVSHPLFDSVGHVAHEGLHPERRAPGLQEPHAEHITVAVERDSERQVARAALHRPEPVRSSSAGGSGGEAVGDRGEVDELPRECLEAVEVGEVRSDPERRPDRATGGEADRLDVVVERHALADPPPTRVLRAIVNAICPAPGLQKQPVRSDTLCADAMRST